MCELSSNACLLLQCPSTGKILSYFGFSDVGQLTVGHLEKICSAVLTQVLLPSCTYAVPTSQPPLHPSSELLHHAAGLFVRLPAAQIQFRTGTGSGTFLSPPMFEKYQTVVTSD